MVHKEQVPPATPTPITLALKGPVEASSRDLPLEALQGSEAKLHRCEWLPQLQAPPGARVRGFPSKMRSLVTFHSCLGWET